MAQEQDGLIWEIEFPLPERLISGEGNILYICGWCFYHQQPITRLEITINGICYPVIAHSTSRADIVRRYALQVTPREICPQIGFWALVPIFKPQAPEVIKIGLGITLYDRSEINCPIGELTVYPDHSYVEEEPESLPRSANDDALIAICLASYTPPLKLFRRQIESIRNQTYRNWICVISDDGSPPEVLEEMRKIIGEDDRFRLYASAKHLGFYHNFERSLQLSPREAQYICLSDHDDYWYPEKLQTLVSQFDDETVLVYSDMRIVDDKGMVLSNTYWTTRKNNHTDFSRLIIANTITGAASLFHRSLLQYILPFPQKVGSFFHDHWIACIAMALGKVRYIDRPLYDYIQHSSNVLGHCHADGYSIRKSISNIFHQMASVPGRLYARDVYFNEVIRIKVIALITSMRIGHLITPKKRKTLARIAKLDSSLSALLWLSLHGLKDWGSTTITIGSEYQMALGACWKIYSHFKARLYLLRLKSALQKSKKLEMDHPS